MDTDVSVEVLRPSALGPSELAAWKRFLDISPQLASPYFRPEYALAADGVVPDAQVAILHQDGAIRGFLPFQRRGGVLQPLAAPLTDYHGLIAPPGARIALETVVRALRGRAFRFTGLSPQDEPASGRSFAQTVMAADVADGYAAYLAARPKARRFHKERQRFLNALVRDHGPIRFVGDDDISTMDFVISRKRDQYRRTGSHDIFECGWTERFLRRLWEERTPALAGRISALHAEEGPVAALYSLRAGSVAHLWFSAYEPALSRYGPGTLLFLDVVRDAADDPRLSLLDFGTDAGGDYKRHYASPNGVVLEGEVLVTAVGRRSSRAFDAALRAAPGLQRLGDVRERLRRRFDLISACETDPRGRLRGTLRAFAAVGRRRAPASN